MMGTFEELEANYQAHLLEERRADWLTPKNRDHDAEWEIDRVVVSAHRIEKNGGEFNRVHFALPPEIDQTVTIRSLSTPAFLARAVAQKLSGILASGDANGLSCVEVASVIKDLESADYFAENFLSTNSFIVSGERSDNLEAKE